VFVAGEFPEEEEAEVEPEEVGDGVPTEPPAAGEAYEEGRDIVDVVEIGE